MSSAEARSESAGGGARGSVAAWLVAAAFAAPVLAIVLSGHNAGRAAFDSIVYHEHFIRRLAEEAPTVDLSNPLTATTPGFHMLLAAASLAGLESTTALRLVAMAIGALLVWCVARWCERVAGRAAGAILALPLAASVYVIGSGAWLLPDDLAWLLVAAIVACCLRPSCTRRDLAIAAALLVPLVLVRQTHLWVAAVVWMAAFRVRAGESDPGFAQRARRALPWVVATLPAFAAVALFAWIWGGLVPPRFQGELQSLNPATPAFLCLEFAILSLGFAPWVAGALVRAWRSAPRAIVAAAVAGLLLAAVPETTESIAGGRYSGWWVIVGKLPVIAERTGVAMLVLAPAGAAMLAALLVGVDRARRPVLAMAVIAFGAAVTMQHYAWQRYHEPFLLLLLPALCLLQEDGWRWKPRFALAPLAFAGVLAMVTSRALHTDPVATGSIPPAVHRAEGDRYYDGPRRRTDEEVAAAIADEAARK
ncbi:MAG: hypothetical protein RI967_382 [Planctomycetota bacterium]